MAADESDVNRLQLIDDLDDKSILVATDIENNPIAGEKTGCRKLGLDLRWVAPAGRLDKGVPGLEWLLGIAMARLPELHQGPLGDNAHVAERLLPLWELRAGLSRSGVKRG